MASRGHQQNHRRNERGPRKSMLLEGFRSNRFHNLQLADIVSHVVEFVTDFDGSKFVQRKLDDAPVLRKEMIYREMRPNMYLLMKDRYANFVVQKFFDVGDLLQRLELVESIQNHFMELCLNRYGCRVVQTAIEKMPLQQQLSMVNRRTAGDIIQVAMDPNGNHVMQKYFKHGDAYIKVNIRLYFRLTFKINDFFCFWFLIFGFCFDI